MMDGIGTRQSLDEAGITGDPWPLPQAWTWAEAHSFADVVGGATPSDAVDSANYDPQGIPWITPADLSGYSSSTIRKGARSLSKTGLQRCSTRMLPAGSVLISSRAPVGYCVVAEVPVCTNQGFKSLKLKAAIDPFFLRYFVLFARRRLNDAASGTTFKELSGRAMEQIMFPLAPLAEQRRIVARIDALFAGIAEGEAALAAARKGLDTFSRALLKAAVTGELTKDWRLANQVTETGQDVLARIQTIRAAKITAKGRRQNGANIQLNDTVLNQLPDGWVWTSLGDISSLVTDGDHNPPKRVSNGVPHITAKNIKQGRVTLEGCSFVSEEGYAQTASRYTPIDGDILITCVGTLGEIAIFRSLDRISVDRNIAAVRLEKGIAIAFVELILNSPKTAAEMRRASGSTAQPHLYLKDIRGIAIPVPPPAETAEILRIVSDALAASADTLAMLDAEAADAARLKQSILKAAFEGRLVPQDPDDEPASALLARLGAAPAKEKPARRRRPAKNS